MADTGKVTYRISMFKGGVMTGFAVIAEALQVILNISGPGAIGAPIVAAAVGGGITVTFFFSGVHVLSGKKAFKKFFTWIITWVIELIPFLDALPGLTIGTVVLIHTSRVEDREKFKLKQKAAANDNDTPQRKAA